MCLAVIGRPLSSQIDELQWSGRDVFRWRFQEVNGSLRHCGDHACEGFHVALKHRICFQLMIQIFGQNLSSNWKNLVQIYFTHKNTSPSCATPLFLILLLCLHKLLNVYKHETVEQPDHTNEPNRQIKMQCFGFSCKLFKSSWKLKVCSWGQRPCRELAVLDHVLLPLFQ